ncbi:hypothetical protein LX36DRAFT_658287 [Colletotrichum falcatum]|nr:hypothetical protein LX36DRAFT_658287 [Colletotrichum falcatum]
MLQPHGGPHNNGTDKHHEEPRGRSRTPTTQLQLPKNRSTGNLEVTTDNNANLGRMRFSFDAGSVVDGGDAMSRLVSPLDTPRYVSTDLARLPVRQRFCQLLLNSALSRQDGRLGDETQCLGGRGARGVHVGAL